MSNPGAIFGPIMTRPAGVWPEYLHLAARRRYPAGAVLLRPGEIIDHLWLVTGGEVLVSHSLTPETIHGLFIFRKYTLLGLLGFFSPSPTFANWLVLKPAVLHLFSRECVYEQLPRVLLLDLLEQYNNLSRSLSRRFAVAGGKAVDARVAQLLLHLLDVALEGNMPAGNRVDFPPGLTQTMTGYMLGMHAVTLNRALSSFRDRGILGRFTKNRLEILDLAALRRIAAGPL